MPAHATALGKVLLAHHPSSEFASNNHELPAFTKATITNRVQLDRELTRAREQGWSAEIGELSPDQASIAAPIVDRRGTVAGAIAVFGPTERLVNARKPRSDLVGCVREAARAVSRELGALPW
jgi:DNA-binding IclR family transcriptional regulator